MKNIFVSIIIVTWNTSEITTKCISTILKYPPSKKFEIIVVDNNSEDNTQQNLKRFGDKIIYIKNDQNYGFSKANNIGASKASGEILFFLNSDMEFVDNNVQPFLDYINKNPKIGLIGPLFLNPDLSSQPSVFPPQTALNAFKEFWLGINNSFTKYVPKTNKHSIVSNISGGAVAIKKSFFKQIGGWSEKYFFYFEDLDLCRKVTKKGKQICFYPKLKVIHRHGASGKNLAPPKDQWKRLIPGSKIYHGKLTHYLINNIIWSGQKLSKLKQLVLKK